MLYTSILWFSKKNSIFGGEIDDVWSLFRAVLDAIIAFAYLHFTRLISVSYIVMPAVCTAKIKNNPFVIVWKEIFAKWRLRGIHNKLLLIELCKSEIKGYRMRGHLSIALINVYRIVFIIAAISASSGVWNLRIQEHQITTAIKSVDTQFPAKTRRRCRRRALGKSARKYRKMSTRSAGEV